MNINKNLLKGLFLLGLFGQGGFAGVNSVVNGMEMGTAALRAPSLILAKKAEKDGCNVKKTYILKATSDFIRLTNDLFALYNLCNKGDENWYKWTKLMWIGQDLRSLFNELKLIKSNNFENCEQDYDQDYEDVLESEDVNKKLSDFLEKLNLYVLPTVEGVSALALSCNGVVNGKSDEFNQKLSLTIQGILSGSRLLAEAIEFKTGSVEQKLLIAKTVIQAVVLFTDLLKPEHKKQNNKKSDGPIEIEMKEINKQPEVQLDSEQVQPAVEQSASQPKKRRGSIGRRELAGLQYIPGGELGRISVMGSDGEVHFVDARLANAPADFTKYYGRS